MNDLDKILIDINERKQRLLTEPTREDAAWAVAEMERLEGILNAFANAEECKVEEPRDDTPRTDQESGYFNSMGDFMHAKDGPYVPSNFARELERENTGQREQAGYARQLIWDWWKPETTSQAVHRQYALSALANDKTTEPVGTQ